MTDLASAMDGAWARSHPDPLLAQSAMDRLQSAAYELVVEGDSYRQRQKPALGKPANPAPPN